MKEYNRDVLNSHRKDLGPLLQMENGRISTNSPENSVPMNIEFRTRGILIFNKTHNQSERFDLEHIDSVNTEPFNLNEPGQGKTLIAIIVKREDCRQKVYMEVEYPDFILNSLKKMISDHQKSKEKDEDGKNFSRVLRELNSLFNDGIITEAEFNERKASVLKKMTDM